MPFQLDRDGIVRAQVSRGTRVRVPAMPVQGDHDDVGNDRARPATCHFRCARNRAVACPANSATLVQIYSYPGGTTIRLHQNR
jgi:hypothetical protein